MALSRVNRLQVFSSDAFGSGAFTSASFTPGNNSELIVFIAGTSYDGSTVSGTTLTISGGGLGWSQQKNINNGGFWPAGQACWVAAVGTGASMTITADSGAAVVDVYSIEVYEYTGHDTSTPVGATASGSSSASDGAISGTLSAAPATDSEVLGSMLTLGASSSVSPGSGYSEIYDNSSVDGFTRETEVRTASTSTTVAWTDIDVPGTGGDGNSWIAIEIKAAAGGGAAASLPPAGQWFNSVPPALRLAA